MKLYLINLPAEEQRRGEKAGTMSSNAGSAARVSRTVAHMMMTMPDNVEILSAEDDELCTPRNVDL